MTILPMSRQGTTPGVDIPHPQPGKIGGATKEVIELLCGKSHRPVYFLPDGFFTREGQRHIYPVQGHPVHLPLPTGPIPPSPPIITTPHLLQIPTFSATP